MSAKHTPGPWTTTPSGEASFIPLRSHHCEKLGFCIGFVNYDINDGQGSIPEANARLIASAPDLLKVLRMARAKIAAELQVMVMGHTGPDGLIDDAEVVLLIEAEQDLLNQIDAAIFKAIG